MTDTLTTEEIRTVAEMYANVREWEISDFLDENEVKFYVPPTHEGGTDWNVVDCRVDDLNILSEILQKWSTDNTNETHIALFDIHFDPDRGLHEVDLSIQNRNIARSKSKGTHRKGIDPDLRVATIKALHEMRGEKK